MSKKRKSPAGKHAPYSPDAKAKTLALAHELLSCGNTREATAKKIGISPNTLKKWLKSEKTDRQVKEVMDRAQKEKEWKKSVDRELLGQDARFQYLQYLFNALRYGVLFSLVMSLVAIGLSVFL